MPEQDKQEPKPKAKAGGRRTGLLAGLLALVALVAVWLSDCIPGFGWGSQGAADGEAKLGDEAEPAAEPAEPEPEPEPAEPEADEAEGEPPPVRLTIDARGCLIDGGEPQNCDALCEADHARDELFGGREVVIIDAKHGSHEAVTKFRSCLEAKQLAVSVTTN